LNIFSSKLLQKRLTDKHFRNKWTFWRKRVPQRQEGDRFDLKFKELWDSHGGYSPDLIATTSVTPRRMANAAATTSILLAVHRTMDIPVRFSALPEARSLPEGPMRGRTAIAVIFLSFSFSLSLSLSLSPLFLFLLVYFYLSLALLKREKEGEVSQRHALCTQIYMLVRVFSRSLHFCQIFRVKNSEFVPREMQNKKSARNGINLKKKDKTTTRHERTWAQFMARAYDTRTVAIIGRLTRRAVHGTNMASSYPLPRSNHKTGWGGPVAEFGKTRETRSNFKFARPSLGRGAWNCF